MPRWPWTNSQLKKLTDHVREGTEPEAGLPPYNEVMSFYDDLAAQVQQDIRNLDLAPLLGDVPTEVTSRAKTIDTLRKKLQMYPDQRINTVQDVAGVRFEAEMSTDQQDGVVTAICGLYEDEQVVVKDMRTESHSGYRAVHIWLRLPAKVEIQVRTHLQGLWANAYESAADLLGRGIRYGQMPETDEERRVVTGLQAISTEQIPMLEEMRALEGQLSSTLSDLDIPALGPPEQGYNESYRGALEEQLSILQDEYMTRELEFRRDLTKVKEMFDVMSAQREE